MNSSLKFTYEDAVDYVLGRLTDEKKKLFEDELKINEELQVLVRLAEVNKEKIIEIEKHQFDDEFYDNLSKKVKNLLKKDIEIKPGYVFKIDISDFEHKMRLFLEDLYFVVLTSPDASITGKDVRVIPLSRLRNYVQNYDLVMTDKLISSREFNTIAHMHLVTNVMVERLKYFYGKLDDNNFKAIVLADLKDYSFVDQQKILSGDEFRRRHPINEYFDEEYESWYSIVKSAIDRLRQEVFEKADIHSEISEQKAEAFYLTSKMDLEKIYSKKLKLISAYISAKDKTSDKRKKSFKYYLDDEGFIIVRDDQNILAEKFNLISKSENPIYSEVDFSKLKKMVYQKINDLEKDYLRNNLINDFKIKIENYSELFERQIEYRLAARQHALTEIPTHSLTLYEDQRLSVLFAFYDEKLFIEINFLEKETIKSIEDFHFVILANSSGFLVPQIKVDFNQVKIPLELSREEVESLQEGYIIGFIYKNISVKLYLKLLLN